FHDAPARIFKPCLVVFDLFDSLELEIAFWIVLVGDSDVVGQRFEPARFEHLHHHRSARAREPGHDGYCFVVHRFRRASFTRSGNLAQDRRHAPVSGAASCLWVLVASVPFINYAATASFAGTLSGESSLGLSENPSFNPKMNSTNAIAPIANNVSPGIRSHRSVAINGVPMNSGLLAYQ